MVGAIQPYFLGDTAPGNTRERAMRPATPAAAGGGHCRAQERNMVASAPGSCPRLSGACSPHPPTPTHSRDIRASGLLEAWLDEGEQHGRHHDWPT